MIGASGAGVGEATGAGSSQYTTVLPQYPHLEQQRPALEQIPFPTLPPPQVPCPSGVGAGTGEVDGYGAVGVGGEGAGTGAGVVGATGPSEMEISAQFQNCSTRSKNDCES